VRFCLSSKGITNGFVKRVKNTESRRGQKGIKQKVRGFLELGYLCKQLKFNQKSLYLLFIKEFIKIFP
jgi:hypothetical protein